MLLYVWSDKCPIVKLKVDCNFATHRLYGCILKTPNFLSALRERFRRFSNAPINSILQLIIAATRKRKVRWLIIRCSSQFIYVYIKSKNGNRVLVWCKKFGLTLNVNNSTPCWCVAIMRRKEWETLHIYSKGRSEATNYNLTGIVAFRHCNQHLWPWASV